MGNLFSRLIPLGIFLFAIGMFVKTFSEANNPSFTDPFGLINGLIIIGAICSVIGIVGWIVKR